MWKCRHCKNEYDFQNGSQKANHTRWCDKNVRRDSWDKSKGTIIRYGELKEFSVECKCCSKVFKVKEREKVHPKKDAYYCSRACANSVGGKAKSAKHFTVDKAGYRTIAWRYHEKKCIVCEEINVVAVHHMNEDHNDNRPENLVPLCPTHHQYMHSKHKCLIEHKVLEYIKNWGALRASTNPLQGI